MTTRTTHADDIKTIRDALKAADNRMNEMSRFIPKLAPDFRYLQALAALERLEKSAVPDGWVLVPETRPQILGFSKPKLTTLIYSQCPVSENGTIHTSHVQNVYVQLNEIAAIAQKQGEK